MSGLTFFPFGSGEMMAAKEGYGASSDAAGSSKPSIRSFGAYKRFWEKKTGTSPNKDDVSPPSKGGGVTQSEYKPVFHPRKLPVGSTRPTAAEGSGQVKQVDFASTVRKERPPQTVSTYGANFNTPRINKLKEYLRKLKLDRYLGAMNRKLGVGLISDLLLITEEDVNSLGMRPIEARRFLLELEHLRTVDASCIDGSRTPPLRPSSEMSFTSDAEQREMGSVDWQLLKFETSPIASKPAHTSIELSPTQLLTLANQKMVAEAKQKELERQEALRHRNAVNARQSQVYLEHLVMNACVSQSPGNVSSSSLDNSITHSGKTNNFAEVKQLGRSQEFVRLAAAKPVEAQAPREQEQESDANVSVAHGNEWFGLPSTPSQPHKPEMPDMQRSTHMNKEGIAAGRGDASVDGERRQVKQLLKSQEPAMNGSTPFQPEENDEHEIETVEDVSTETSQRDQVSTRKSSKTLVKETPRTENSGSMENFKAHAVSDHPCGASSVKFNPVTGMNAGSLQDRENIDKSRLRLHLLSQLHTPNLISRRNAIEAIASLVNAQDKVLVAELLLSLNDNHVEIRKATIDALIPAANQGHLEAYAGIQSSLDDKEADVRLHAIKALIQVDWTQEGTPKALMNRLSDPDRYEQEKEKEKERNFYAASFKVRAKAKDLLVKYATAGNAEAASILLCSGFQPSPAVWKEQNEQSSRPGRESVAFLC
ncbi:hypothetical protein GUITHDRAFT_113796 [Guillardia theta CCMP2712]|uniref:SAM domain-containing protein n=1 Tax=Guillardia theta (strain CCMP2712) TaxID=905079 RepID=L1IVB6_GUITC|nr:hypothetical protein GUITHDRAFT_113796 [Guillardia theta CCMP2712]EKX40057.1 hypothetical protein GUITHDRAFT_113796 [Guillardia theta CCMP2712]|eukprot:XP_005827037.1 hypothetical protein GUITHDRAFT_113796 [Guillardia theta CCMP2712]